MEMIQILLGVFIGGIMVWLWTRVTASKALSQKQYELLSLEKELNQVKTDQVHKHDEIKLLRNELVQCKIDKAALDAENLHLLKTNEEKVKEVSELQEKLAKEFESIANRVLIHRSKEMSDQNQQKMVDLLSPLKEKITLFEKKVEETYDKEVRDKLNLQAEVKRLYELNVRISEEAHNLTRALKGDVKKLGNWGEVILERVLEQSGLTRGREYRREVSDKNGEGKSIRPDVIIDLPENKHLIIDSKLTLVAYEAYVNASNELEQQVALKKHKERLREHIKGLYEKNYASAKQLNCPDFVLMFIPVEASFSVAVESDTELFTFAWDRKIVLVSPSTLLATLKTISSIWRQENQTKNAQDIAQQSGALYDKLVGFIADLDKIGHNIDQLQNNYSAALGKLKSGRGNIISRAEKIKELGAKTNKEIPDKFIGE